MKTMTLTALIALAAAAMLAGCGKSDKTAETGADSEEQQALRVQLGRIHRRGRGAPMFEEETGIEVVYDVFETNEEMFPIIEAGGCEVRRGLSLRLHDPAHDPERHAGSAEL